MPLPAENASFSFSSITPGQRRTFLAAVLGWMLDAFDVMLYALVLTHIMRDLGMGKAAAGLLGTLTLLASGIGGVLFGLIADRIGRRRALMLSILTYSVCSFGSGLATSVYMLAAFRFVLGLGMGGEWTTGAALVAETWPIHLRAKVLSVVQSSWAIGYALAAFVAWVVLRHWNWRAVFFVGVLPALVTLWIRKDVPESEMWREQHARTLGKDPAPQATFGELISGRYAKTAFVLMFMNFFGMFAWWGLFTWVPAYLSLPLAQGGRGFNPAQMTTMLVALNLTGMFPGYVGYGWIADRIGRRTTVIMFALAAALLVPVYALARDPWWLLLLGTPVAFFGTGYFSGPAIIASEVFPTSIRARALGFTYNGARTLSSVSPLIIGWVAERKGLSWAFSLCSIGFFLSMLMATQLPETRGKQLE